MVSYQWNKKLLELIPEDERPIYLHGKSSRYNIEKRMKWGWTLPDVAGGCKSYASITMDFIGMYILDYGYG